ncbi:MAG TPA: hypothetical protein VHG51_11215 [Longimicrobiaceae bacterium]|nr:hypothetical protein [Longimicrobiaceae bacterium]
MTAIRLLLALLALLGAPVQAAAQRSSAPDLRVDTHSGTPLEERGREQLLRLARQYPLEKWLFTREVRIRTGVIPHSHPVLTLNTRYLEDDHRQLATFVHEQLHWFLEARPGPTAAAVRELRGMYPEVPVGGGEGARDEHSTYLHLLVCTLELDAASELLGEARARELLGTSGHYRWIYRQVLTRTPQLRGVLERHGLTPGGA